MHMIRKGQLKGSGKGSVALIKFRQINFNEINPL